MENIGIVKMVIARLFLLFIVGGLLACNSPKNTAPLKDLDYQFIQRITEFPDSSFFSDVRMMEYENGKIYLLDAKRGDLVALTEDFENVKIAAPHSEIDLVMPGTFKVKNDTLYVCDYGSVKTLKLYHDGKHIESLSSFDFKEKRMAMNGRHIYVSEPTDTSCFLKIDRINPNKKIKGGLVVKEQGHKRTKLMNKKHFFSNDANELFVVSECYPYIDRYGLNEEMNIERLDFSHLSFVQDNMDFINYQPVEPRTYYVYIADGCLYKEALYLLCASLGEPYRCNILLKVDVGSKKMQLVGYFELPGNVYRSICVSDEFLFAAYYGRDCAIEKYKLNDN